MCKYYTITPGMNLKKIRKSLDLRQHDITGGEITRNLVSLIENNKTPFQYRTAKLIAQNINKISQKRNLNIFIDPRDLLEPERMNIKNKLDEFIKEIHLCLDDEKLELKENEIRDVEKIFVKWDIIDKKVTIYELLGDYCFIKKDLYKSYVNYLKAFDGSSRLMDSQIIARLIAKVMKVCIYLKKYSEALKYGELIVEEDIIEESTLTNILYNKALCYQYLGKYDVCLNIIDTLVDIIDEKETDKYFDLLILKAICFKSKEMYLEAINIYKMLKTSLGTKLSIEKQSIIISNSLVIYCITKDYINAKICLDDLNKLVNKLSSSSPYLARLQLEAAKGYRFLGNIFLAKKCFLESIQNSKEIMDLSTIDSAIEDAIDLYIAHELKDVDLLNHVRNLKLKFTKE